MIVSWSPSHLASLFSFGRALRAESIHFCYILFHFNLSFGMGVIRERGWPSSESVVFGVRECVQNGVITHSDAAFLAPEDDPRPLPLPFYSRHQLSLCR